MATVQPQTGEDRPPFCLTLGRRPGSDPRYRVLQRRDVREAVRIQLATVMAIVIGSMAIIGLHHSLVDGAALATLATSAVLLVDRRIVQRRPHATAVFSGIVLDLLIAATLIDVPDKTTLVIGAYGITIVSSTLFVAFDWRSTGGRTSCGWRFRSGCGSSRSRSRPSATPRVSRLWPLPQLRS